MSPARFALESPAGRAGAIALVRVWGDLPAAFEALKIRPVPSGRLGVRMLGDVDEIVIARWSEREAHLMPHGGVAVTAAVAAYLTACGLEPINPLAKAGEARPGEPGLHHALSYAASPLAIDVLLDHTRRWEKGVTEPVPEPVAHALGHLVRPPLIAAWGPPNIGKSSLLNALAQREIAIVADEPGTTRDHVGVMLNLGGLVARYLDTPGVRETADAIEFESLAIARATVAAADLVLWCSDATSSRPHLEGVPPDRVVRLDLRSDLGSPSEPGDLAVSIRDPDSIGRLAAFLRERLVPAQALGAPGLWRFWE